MGKTRVKFRCSTSESKEDSKDVIILDPDKEYSIDFDNGIIEEVTSEVSAMDQTTPNPPPPPKP